MSDPISRLGAAGAGVHPPNRAATFAKTQAGIAAGYRPGYQTGMAVKVTGVVVALAVIGVGGYLAAAGIAGQGQPGPVPPVVADTPTPTTAPPTTTEPNDPTDEPELEPTEPVQEAPSVEQVGAALANPDLVWTRTFHDPLGGASQRYQLVRVDGSVVVSSHGRYYDDQLEWGFEGLYKTKDGVISDTEVYHQTFAWGTHEQTVAECEANDDCVNWTQTIPRELSVLTELTLATVARGGESDPGEPGVHTAGWRYEAEASDIPAVLQGLGVTGATIWIDKDTLLPADMALTFLASSLQAAADDPGSELASLAFFLGLGEPIGLGYCVDQDGLIAREAGTCMAYPNFAWLTYDDAFDMGLFELNIDTDVYCYANEHQCN